MQRGRGRGRARERTLAADCPGRVAEAYARLFAGYREGPLLAVDAGAFSPIERDADFSALCEPAHGRRYFNPAPLGIH